MTSSPGRILRIAAGLGLLAAGLTRRDTTGGRAAALLALVPLLSGTFDVCACGSGSGAACRTDD